MTTTIQTAITASNIDPAVKSLLLNILGFQGPSYLPFPFASVSLTGLLYESVTDNLTAHAGGGQASALALTSELNRVTTVATANDSVALPASAAGLSIVVVNSGANPMQVFGAGTDTINNVATATGVSQMPGSLVLYVCHTAGTWYTTGLGVGYSGSYETSSFKNSITAHAGGTQAGAIGDANAILPAMLNRLTVVASANDSVVLPVSVAGMVITVMNGAATNSANVYPQTGEYMNLTQNAALGLAAGKAAQFICTVAGTWHSILSA